MRSRRADGWSGSAADSSASVYGWSGSVYTASHSPVSTSLPQYMTARRVARYRAAARSCEIMMYASPSRSCSRLSRLRIWARIDTSSAETGSSSTMKRGVVTSARAIAMRWRWPPLNSCG